MAAPPADVDVVVVGAGFAGLYALHKLRGLGFAVQGFEIADDVGGTWYWNRYPGARCDVESMDYSYSFDDELQQDWEWTERFATQPEIQRYTAHVADRFDLRPLIRFETRVERADWNEDTRCWRIVTDRSDTTVARFVILATGSLSAAKAPDIPGLDDFAGPAYFTAHWPHEGVDFAGMRVGVIGTGSSAIQAIPLIAEQATHLTVFQRTPNFSMPAHNAPMTSEYQAAFKARYAEHRAQARVSRTGVLFHSTGKSALDVDDDERVSHYEEAWRRGGPGLPSVFTDMLANEQANHHAAEFVRGKIRETVLDRDVAEALTPRGYPIASKRLAVDTNYYATFNRDNVTLKDLRKHPLERIAPEGVVTADGTTVLDALVLATGFDAMTGSYTRIDTHGTHGTLAEKWSAGPRTYLGLMSEGFPNLFIVAGPGSPSVLSNMILSCEQHVEWIADCLGALRDAGETRIEPTLAAEDKWTQDVTALAAGTLFMKGNSWYLGANVPGKPRVFMPYIGGVGEYRRLTGEIAADDYRGFTRA